jgi:hypothetical protein
MPEEDVMEGVFDFIERYATSKSLGIVAVLSGDVGGLTYVARWVKTDSLENIPEGSSWADITKEKNDESISKS